MKKIAVINDIHGNYLLLERVLLELKLANVDEYIFCGDMVSDGFENNLVIEKVKSLSKNIVLGNRDVDIISYDGYSWLKNEHYKNMLYAYKEITNENKNFLRKLPIYNIVEIENKKIYYAHGTPDNVSAVIKPYNIEIFDKLIEEYNCDIYLFAHTHQNFDIKYKNKYFINSGAINCSVTGKPSSTYGIITIDKDNISYEQKEYIYDFDELKKYYLTSDYYKYCPEWSNLILHNLRTGIDHCIPFRNSYDDKLTYKENFYKYMQENNLEIY